MNDYTAPNLNFENEKTIRLIKSLVNKGDVLEWRQPMDGDRWKDNKGKFRVTSIKVQSWGSVYINLRLLKGRYFNRDLREYLTSQDTEYKNKKERDQFKYYNLKMLIHNKLKLLGYGSHSIFIKRLYLTCLKKNTNTYKNS